VDQEHIFTIEYKLYGVPKKFIMRAARLNDETAWHWAACDAGATPIPKRGKLPLKLCSKPMAERYGVTDVLWRGPGSAWGKGGLSS